MNAPSVENTVENPKKIEKDLPVSTTSLLVIYPKETKLVFQRDTCYTGLPEKRNQSRFPPGTAEYYTVIKKETILSIHHPDGTGYPIVEGNELWTEKQVPHGFTLTRKLRQFSWQR